MDCDIFYLTFEGDFSHNFAGIGTNEENNECIR